MASGNTQRGALARFSLRTIALIVGLVDSVLALIVNLLYGFFHLLGRVAGIANDSSHFFLGLLVVLIGVFGSLTAPVLPVFAGIALAVAGIALLLCRGLVGAVRLAILLGGRTAHHKQSPREPAVGDLSVVHSKAATGRMTRNPKNAREGPRRHPAARSHTDRILCQDHRGLDLLAVRFAGV